jgi:hypothetical protein
VGGRKSANSRFFLSRLAFFSPVFFFALSRLFGLALASAKARKKRQRSPLVTSNGLVTFKVAATSNRNRIVTLKMGKALKVASLFYQ